MECNHFWVKRLDGYEEQCTAAICLICGKYSCRCNLAAVPEKLKERRLKLFNELGINGNAHELEKSLKE